MSLSRNKERLLARLKGGRSRAKEGLFVVEGVRGGVEGEDRPGAARGGVEREDIVCFGDYVGPGYSLPTQSMVEAVKLFACNEAILLDPVYSGKAAAGLIDQVRKGAFAKGSNVLFLHTGGSPALYAYLDTFR